MRLPEMTTHEQENAQHDGEHGIDMGSDGLLSGDAGMQSRSGIAHFIDRFGSIMLLCVVIGVSAALLYGMRKLGTAGKLDLVNITIDYPMDSMNRSGAENHREIIDELLHGHIVEQVPVDRIQMNPFHWQWMAPTSGTNTGMTEAERLAAEAKRAAEEKRRRMDSALSSMKLNSVIGGRRPAAYISGERYMIGDVVSEMFTVQSIEGRSVVLVHEDEEFVLTIGD